MALAPWAAKPIQAPVPCVAKLPDEFKRFGNRNKLYRAMRTDCKDLGLSTMDPPNPSPDDLRALVVKCVTRGSTMPSDFLHCSWSLQEAKQWHEKARVDSQRHEDKSKQYLVCVDLFDWYNIAKQMGEDMIDDVIDISSDSKQKLFFSKGMDGYRDAGKSIGFGSASYWEHQWDLCMRQASAAQEVLLKWRGFVPVSVMSVVDENGKTISKNVYDYICLRQEGSPLGRAFNEAFLSNEHYIQRKQNERKPKPPQGEAYQQDEQANQQQEPGQEPPHDVFLDSAEVWPSPPQDEAYQQDEQANQQDDPPQGEANQQDGTQEQPFRATGVHRGCDPEAVRLFYDKARELEQEFMRNVHKEVKRDALFEVVQGAIGKSEEFHHDYSNVISLSPLSGCSQKVTTDDPDVAYLTQKRLLKHELARKLRVVVKSKASNMMWEHRSRLRSRLIGLLGDQPRNGVTLSGVLEAQILSPFSIQLLTLDLVPFPPQVCPEKRGVFPEVLLAEMGYIVLPPGHRPGSLIGTKDADESPATFTESRIIDDETKTGQPNMWWSSWWLSLLGFKDTGGRYVRAYVRT